MSRSWKFGACSPGLTTPRCAIEPTLSAKTTEETTVAMASETQTRASPPAERERVIRTLRAHAAALRALGVAQLWLFGSLARGDAGPDSDVDVLISVPPTRKFSLLDLAEVRLALSDLLGREAGVVIREDLRPRFRDTIADDLIEVF